MAADLRNGAIKVSVEQAGHDFLIAGGTLCLARSS
jgi:hypothetical protein